LDLAKYRALFVEDATEHLAEMSRALLDLEKDPGRGEDIDRVFRMAHSIKGMAASLAYEAIAEAAHELEDRMQEIRSRGGIEAGGEMTLLFEGLAELETMVGAVRETGEPPARREPPKKKALSPSPPP
jgi:two-component system chemotaxis sensor kinase CheA